MLALGAEVDARRELEGEHTGVLVRLVDVRLHDTTELSKVLERDLACRTVGHHFVVGDRLDLGGEKRTALCLRDDAEALPALDRDVETAVVEAVEHVHDGRTCADVPHAVVVGEDETELAVVREALADQLLVAELEDVERDPLGGHEHDPEREQPELVHQPPQPCGGSRRPSTAVQ